MHVHDSVVVAGPPERVAPWLDDLGVYPQWMGLVHRAAPTEGDAPAWNVELRARIGPLARSKRLRMERSGEPGRWVFERRELDGRRHGRWVLTVSYALSGEGTRVEVDLRYEGQLWSAGLLERTLHDEIDHAKVRLAELVEGGVTPSGPTR